jgi:hypothetical protein
MLTINHHHEAESFYRKKCQLLGRGQHCHIRGLRLCFLFLQETSLHSIPNVYGVPVYKTWTKGDNVLAFYWLSGRGSTLLAEHTMPPYTVYKF